MRERRKGIGGLNHGPGGEAGAVWSGTAELTLGGPPYYSFRP
jgi:hypothetical protein